jgi:hypothetical protein
MPLIIAGALFRQTGPQRQNPLGPIQCLYLRFLIQAQYHGVFRRIQLQTHDIPHFLCQPGIGG